jgi:carboxyl-terminal processing protease
MSGAHRLIIVGKGLAVFSFLILGSALLVAQSAPNPKQLVDEAWRAVDSTYYDPSFGGLDWPAVRDSFLARDYASAAEAYAGIREMLGRLGDPATRFLTPQQASALLAEFSGAPHEGVGLLEVLSLDVDEGSGAIVVVTPVPGWPAARAGLRPGDVLLSVDGASAETLGLAETMSRLRGRPGTSVDLRIRRGENILDVRVEREGLPAMDPVDGFIREESGTKIGYVGLRQFTAEVPQRMRELIEDLEASGAMAYVLDLRNNPGGLVPPVQGVAALFLGEAPIARLKGRTPEPSALLAEGKRLVERPVIVLVNEGSASAAEVLAGALQDHGRALVVGMRTFGKGLAHGFQPLSDGSAVMPTMGRLETLGGRDLLDVGIAPDVVARARTSPVIDETLVVATPEDVQYRRAIELLASTLKTRGNGGGRGSHLSPTAASASTLPGDATDHAFRTSIGGREATGSTVSTRPVPRSVVAGCGYSALSGDETVGAARSASVRARSARCCVRSPSQPPV